MTDKEKIRKEIERLKSKLMYGACSSQIAMETRCKEEAYNEVLALLDTMQEEPVSRTPVDIEAAMQEVEEKSRAFTEAHKGEDADTILAQMRGEEPVSNPTPNKKMPVERWKRACEAACCDTNYRSHYGLTETRDDYFVDGVQWADEHPKEEPVSEELEEAAEGYGIRQGVELKPFAIKFFKAGAKWQEKQDQKTIQLAEDHAMLAGMEKMKEQMIAKAIDAHCFGFQGAALFTFRLPAGSYLVGSEVKVIVINED